MKDPSKIKVLIACEESQRVCMAFRERGFEAYSCDIQEPSGGHPEWHILGDAIEAINGLVVTTMDGQTHDIGKWDLLIAHPPCTYLTVSGNRWFNKEKYGEKAARRLELREEAAEFFMSFVNADVCKIAIENPVGYMSTYYRKPDCIIQPYEFGHQARKKDLPMAQKSSDFETDKYCKRGRYSSWWVQRRGKLELCERRKRQNYSME